MILIFDSSTTAAFTGYRLEKIFPGGYDAVRYRRIRTRLQQIIQELYKSGYRTFISGMATGFDQWAAESVIMLRESGSCPDIRLVAAVPCRNQADDFDQESRALYVQLLSQADEVFHLSETRSRRCFLRRNDWMLERCSQVICYYDGQPGGTGYTVHRARRLNLPVANLWRPGE